MKSENRAGVTPHLRTQMKQWVSDGQEGQAGEGWEAGQSVPVPFLQTHLGGAVVAGNVVQRPLSCAAITTVLPTREEIVHGLIFPPVLILL